MTISEDDIHRVLKPIAATSPRDVYWAFCNVAWVPHDSPHVTWTDIRDADESDYYEHSWRSAAGMVADLRGKGETYLDFYWDMIPTVATARDFPPGVVLDNVREAMASIGLRPII